MGRRSYKITLAAVVALGLAASVAASAAPAHAKTSPRAACATAKRAASVKLLRAINACFGKALKEQTPPPPDPTCLANANGALQREFLRIEKRGGCEPATGDAPAAERVVNRCELGLVELLPGTCIESGSLCSGSVPCCSGLCRATADGQPGVCN